MAPTGFRGQNGVSLLEFVLALTLIAVLTVFAFERLAGVRVAAERAAVERTVNAMRSALALKAVELLSEGRRERLTEWSGGNALALISGRGVIPQAKHDTLPAEAFGPGDWRYDAAAGHVIYRIRWPAAAGLSFAEARWRVTIARSGGEERGEPVSLRLDAVGDRRWPARVSGGVVQ